MFVARCEVLLAGGISSPLIGLTFIKSMPPLSSPQTRCSSFPSPSVPPAHFPPISNSIQSFARQTRRGTLVTKVQNAPFLVLRRVCRRLLFFLGARRKRFSLLSRANKTHKPTRNAKGKRRVSARLVKEWTAKKCANSLPADKSQRAV